MRRAKPKPEYKVLLDPDACGAIGEDTQNFLDAVLNLAGCECGGGAHVYEHAGFVIVSNMPIPPKEVFRIAHEEEQKLEDEDNAAKAPASVN